MPDYKINIGGRDGTSQKKDELTQIGDLDYTVNHSAMSSYSAVIPYSQSIEQYIREPILIYQNSSIIFKGYLETIESDDSAEETTISGRGALSSYADEPDVTQYQTIAAHTALNDYATSPGPGVASYTAKDESQLVEATPSTTTTVSDLFDGGSGGSTTTLNDGTVAMRRTCWHVDTSEMYVSTYTVQGNNYAEDTAVAFDSGGYVYESVTPDVDWSGGAYSVWMNCETDSSYTENVELVIDGTTYRRLDFSNRSGGSQEWIDLVNDDASTVVNSMPSLISGNTYEIRISVGGSTGDSLYLDTFAITRDGADHEFSDEPLEDANVYAAPREYGRRVKKANDFLQYSATSTDVELYYRMNNHDDAYTGKIQNEDTGTQYEAVYDGDGPTAAPSFTFTVSNATQNIRPYVEFVGTTPDSPTSSGEATQPILDKVAVVGADTAEFAYIADWTLGDSVLSNMQDLAQYAGYRFAVSDWQNVDVDLFPVGTRNTEPDWDFADATRKFDYTEYANAVKAQSGQIVTQNDVFYRSATVKDQTEIDAVGEEIWEIVQSPDLQTKEELRSEARSILNERVKNREHAGSATGSPVTGILPGYEYPVSVWSDAFRDGNRQGVNAINFEGNERGGYERAEFDFGAESNNYKFRFLVHARLGEMNSPRHLLSVDDEADFLVLHPDGSLDFTHPEYGSQGPSVSAPADSVPSNQTVEIELHVNPNTDTLRISIDGTEVASTTSTSIDTAEFTDGKIGSRNRNQQRYNTNTVLNLPLDDEFVADDGSTVFDKSENPSTVYMDNAPSDFSMVSGIYREGIDIGYDGYIRADDDTSLDIGTGDWTISFWAKFPSGHTDNVELLKKGGASSSDPGYRVEITSNVEFWFSDGSNRDGAGIPIVEDEWTHYACVIDRSGEFKRYKNGELYGSTSFDLDSSADITTTNDLLISDASYDTPPIDEVRIYNTQADSLMDELGAMDSIIDTFHGGFDHFVYEKDPNVTGGYVSEYLFDDDSSTTVSDQNGNQSDITLVGPNYEATFASIDEVGYTLGPGGNMDINFDLTGTVGTELNQIDQDVRRALHRRDVRNNEPQ